MGSPEGVEGTLGVRRRALPDIYFIIIRPPSLVKEKDAAKTCICVLRVLR